MKLFLLALLAHSLFATTTIDLKSATPAGFVFVVRSDQSGSCTMKLTDTYTPGVHDFSTAYLPVHDVNATLFPGRDSCGRTWNVDLGSYKELSFGFHATAVSSTDNRRYSLALQADTRFYLQVTVGSDTVTYLNAGTTNPPNGNTYQGTRYARDTPGQYDYPTLDYGNLSKKYIDPLTGIPFSLATSPAQLTPATYAESFANPLTGGSGWSVTGLTASYSGTAQGWLYFRTTNPPMGAIGDGWYPVSPLISYAQFLATLSGTVASVDVCLTNDGSTCAGKAITQAITGSSVVYTIGTTTPVLESWRNATIPPSSTDDIRQHSGNVSVASDRITVAWVSGNLFNPNWAAGSLFTVNGTDCAIASIVDEKNLVLASNTCTTATSNTPYTANIFGFLLRATTAASGTISVTSPSWTAGTAGYPTVYSGGFARQCQEVSYTGPTGPGNLCVTNSIINQSYGTNVIFWVGRDGTANLLGTANTATDVGTGLPGACSNFVSFGWDKTVAGKYWCVGYIGSGPTAKRAVFSVQYSGPATATSSVPDGSQLPNSAIADIFPNLSAAVTALYSPFDTAATSACGELWAVQGTQGKDLLLMCHTVNNQNYPAWLAVFDTQSKTIIAATATWNGPDNSAKRWNGVHTVNFASEGWFFFGTNLFPGYQSTTSSAIPIAPWNNCPTNTVDPGAAGTPNCTTIVLDSLTPLNGGASLFGESWRVGDWAVVTSGGAQDREIVHILTLVGTTAVIERNLGLNHLNYVSGWTNTVHSGSLGLQVVGGAIGSALGSYELWWHYAVDPTGADIADATSPNGRSTFPDPDSADCHEVTSGSILTLGCSEKSHATATYPAFAQVGFPIRNGALPAGFTGPITAFNDNATFAGSTFIPDGNSLESHPSLTATMASAAAEQTFGTDSRPYMGDVTVGTGDATKIGTYLWKVAASRSSAFSYRLQPLLVTTGVFPLIDVSPAVLADTTADQNKFCFVVIAGDCHAASLVGEIYANVKFATVPSAYNARFAANPWIRDLSVSQITSFNHGTYQFGTAKSSPRQEYGRLITGGNSYYKTESVYWGSKQTPSGGYVYWPGTGFDNRADIFLAKVPLQPPVDSLQRNGFINYKVQVTGTIKVRARFGYAENNMSAAFPGFCTPRQVVCTTSGTPFAWIDEAQTVQDCTGGCTVNIPAIAGRTLYYVIDRSQDGIAWTPGTPSAVGVN